MAGFGLVVAKADGRIAQAERKQVRAFLERRYAPTADLAAQIDAILADVESDLPTLGDALWDVRRMIPASAWPDLYQFAASVTDSAGQRNTREAECLARVAEELGIGPAAAPGTAAVPAARPEPMGASPTPAASEAAGTAAVPGADEPPGELECRATLEIAPEAPLGVDLIRRQYRLLSERFAPEKFAGHGPEFVAVAAEKRAKVERAARHLIAEYNEPLDPPAASPPPADPRHNPDLDAVFGV